MMNRREFLKSMMATIGVAVARRVGFVHSPPVDVLAIDRSYNDPPWFLVTDDGVSRVTYNLSAPKVVWHEIELYGYWSRDDLPCGRHYGMNLNSPRYIWAFDYPPRPVLTWEWAWYLEHRDSPAPWYEVSTFPITDSERIEALGKYLGYL